MCSWVTSFMALVMTISFVAVQGRNFVRHVASRLLGCSSCVALTVLLSFVLAARQKQCKDNVTITHPVIPPLAHYLNGFTCNLSACPSVHPAGGLYQSPPQTQTLARWQSPPSIALTQFSTWDAKLRDLQITAQLPQMPMQCHCDGPVRPSIYPRSTQSRAHCRLSNPRSEWLTCVYMQKKH